MNLYLVIRRGAYMQGLWGVYENEEKANEALARAKVQEEDDYHEFTIHIVELNRDADVV